MNALQVTKSLKYLDRMLSSTDDGVHVVMTHNGVKVEGRAVARIEDTLVVYPTGEDQRRTGYAVNWISDISFLVDAEDLEAILEVGILMAGDWLEKTWRADEILEEDVESLDAFLLRKNVSDIASGKSLHGGNKHSSEDPNGHLIDLFHMTDQQTADAIHETAQMHSRKHTFEMLCSTHYDGDLEDSGDVQIHIRIPRTWIDRGWARVTDEFALRNGEREIHYLINVNRLRREHLVNNETDGSQEVR